MTTMKTTMTLEQAFALAVDDNCTAEQWNQAESVLYKAGYCPHCACDGQRNKLKTKHTPEPWIFAYGSIYQCDDANTVEENTGRLALMDRDNPHTVPTERDANARRIVACVNACAGMADPVEEIKRMKDVIYRAERWGQYDIGVLEDMRAILKKDCEA